MYAGMMQASRAEKYRRMRELLHEKQWRHYLALEAQEWGVVMQVAHEAGVSHNTMRMEFHHSSTRFARCCSAYLGGS